MPPTIAIVGDRTDTNPNDDQTRALLASEGAGPLLQRDYKAVISGSKCSPSQVMEQLRRDFARFSPDHLAAFACNKTEPLCVGDEVEINIRMSGLCHVRIVHADDCSLTMRTLDGHPEAGRITFGASNSAEGHLVFRIRSRARASSTIKYVGYELFGKAMQTQVWTTFLQRVAEHCGGAVVDEIAIEEHEVQASLADKGEVDTPTFKADGCAAAH